MSRPSFFKILNHVPHIFLLILIFTLLNYKSTNQSPQKITIVDRPLAADLKYTSNPNICSITSKKPEIFAKQDLRFKFAGPFRGYQDLFIIEQPNHSKSFLILMQVRKLDYVHEYVDRNDHFARITNSNKNHYVFDAAAVYNDKYLQDCSKIESLIHTNFDFRNVGHTTNSLQLYAVLPNDTLYSISRLHCITIAELISYNSSQSVRPLEPGQRLKLPEHACLPYKN